MNRRDFLIASLLGCAIKSFPTIAFERAKFSKSPFSLGIASGDPTHNSVVLWTRLVLDPSKSDGGMEPKIYSVNWQIASDPHMKNVVKTGRSQASPQFAHSVHIDLDNLAPHTQYWYQFSVDTHKSPIGKTKTLARSTSTHSARFITASCQNFTHGYFVAYQHMLDDNPDFIIFLGDYIYDKSFGKSVRQHDSETRPKTLDEYRRRHALYKTDKHLNKAHANVPFFVVPDNHDALIDNDPEKYQQRIAAYQAWYEHMPTRGYFGLRANQFNLHRHIQVGDLLNINLLDTRQYRDIESLPDDNIDTSYAFGNYRKLSASYYDNERSMLGEEQEQWLLNSITNNQASWQIIASPGPLTPFEFYKDEQLFRYIGTWDGYPAAQKRLIDTIKSIKKNNTIVLSGDVHSFWAWDGMQYIDKNNNIPIVEFTTSSVTADWPKELSQPIEDNLPVNPQVKLYEPLLRGYMLHEVTAKTWITTAKAMKSILTNKTDSFIRAKFQVINGQNGFKKIS